MKTSRNSFIDMTTMIRYFLVLGFIVRMAASSTLSDTVSTVRYHRISSHGKVLEMVHRVSALHCARYCSRKSTCYGYDFLTKLHSCHITDSFKGKMIKSRYKAYKKIVSKTQKRGHQRRKKVKECTRKGCGAADKIKTDERSHCILHQQTNISIETGSNHIIYEIPMPLLPGMKFIVNGRYMKGKTDSQISVSKDPNQLTNVLKWFHLIANWDEKKIIITEGIMDNFVYGGGFPISDPLNITMTLEQTPHLTRCYVNKVLITTVKLIPSIKEVLIRRFSKVYSVVVLKTDEECDGMEYGMP